MNATVLELLKKYRNRAEEAWTKNDAVGHSLTKRDFFQVIYDYLANMSKMKVNRIVTGAKGMKPDYWFNQEMTNAISEASRADGAAHRAKLTKMMYESRNAMGMYNKKFN